MAAKRWQSYKRHIIPSWDAYPRIKYFHKHLKSLVPRFKELTGTSACFRSAPLNSKLDDLVKLLENGVKVCLFSDHDIDISSVVVSSKGQDVGMSNIHPRIKISVSSLDVDDLSTFLDDKELKFYLFHVFLEPYKSSYAGSFFWFIILRTKNIYHKKDIETFKKRLIKSVEDRFSIKVTPKMVTVWCEEGEEDTKLAFQISNCFETLIIDGFIQVRNHLEQFVSVKTHHSPFIHGLKNSQRDYKDIHRQLSKLVTVEALEDICSANNKAQSAGVTMTDEIAGPSGNQVNYMNLPHRRFIGDTKSESSSDLEDFIEISDTTSESSIDESFIEFTGATADTFEGDIHQGISATVHSRILRHLRQRKFISDGFQGKKETMDFRTEGQLSDNIVLDDPQDKLSRFISSFAGISRREFFSDEFQGKRETMDLRTKEQLSNETMPDDPQDEQSRVISSVVGIGRREFISDEFQGKKETMDFRTKEQLSDKIMPDDPQDKQSRVISSVAGIVKCLLVPVLSERFNISPSRCNRLLTEIKFIKMLSDALDGNFDVGNLKKCRKELLLKLQDKLPNTLDKVEMIFNRARHYVSLMRKMYYEVHGYLKQTTVDLDCKSCPEAHKIPDELRKTLLRIDGVYGLGTFYGRIEIYLDSELNEDESKLSEVLEQVTNLMIKYHFYDPYDVKLVVQKPKKMSFEPGNKLMARLSKGPTCGTLGGYIIGRCGEVYALTCGHVVGFNDNVRVPTFLITDNKIQQLSGMIHSFHSRTQGNNDFPLIDIGAAQVIKMYKTDCANYLESRESKVVLVNVCNDNENAHVGDRVCKIGAYSGKTNGIIGSADFELFPEEYVIIIDPLHDKNIKLLTQCDTSEPENKALGPENAGHVSENESSNGLFSAENAISELENNSDDPSIQENCQNACNEHSNERHIPIEPFRVYVPDQHKYDEAEGAVFAKRGDSGSIACSSRLNGQIEESIAISMISAGDFKTNCGRENACLSFKLQKGLEKLQEHSSLFW